MKKEKLIKTLIILLIPVVVYFILFYQKICESIKTKHVDYLFQYLIMIVPIVISLILFYIESNDRRKEILNQEKQLNDQRKHQLKMQESLEKMNSILSEQITQQNEMGRLLETTATELRRMRLPKAYDFIYENYNNIKLLFNNDNKITHIINVIARISSMDEIEKKWSSVSSDEIPLSIREEFELAKNYFSEYHKLLKVAYHFITYKHSEGNEKKENPFGLAFNQECTVSELILYTQSQINSLSQVEKNKLNKEINISITSYDSEDKIIRVIENIERNIDSIYDKISYK